MYRTAEQVQRDHVRTIIRHRKEAADRRRAEAVPPEPRMAGLQPHVMYVWRKDQWYLVAFVRRKPTVKWMSRWRERYAIKPKEVVRFKSLWEAQRNGPPQDVPVANDLAGDVRRKRELRDVREAIRVSVRVRGTPDMRRCEHGKRSCTRKGTWMVGYVSTRTNGKVVTHRCTKHAWSDAYLPSTATQIIRVQRSTVS